MRCDTESEQQQEDTQYAPWIQNKTISCTPILPKSRHENLDSGR